MSNKYSLEWLDLLVTITLNPMKTDLKCVTSEQIDVIKEAIIVEKCKFKSELKNQIFGITKENEIQLLLKKYHSTLIILLDEAFDNRKKISKKNRLLKDVCDDLIKCLDEILSFIEVRFSIYLSLDERVSTTYLIVSKKEMKIKVNKLKIKLSQVISDQRIIDLVLHTLYSFTNPSKGYSPITYREVLYKKELVKELEELENSERKTCLYTALIELLVYLNFNSKGFANHFTQKLAEKINEFEKITDKLDLLLMHFKEFNQLHRKPGVVLNPQNRDLKPVLSNWFVQEIFYLEKKMHLSVIPLQSKVESYNARATSAKPKQKILCILSSDQIGLILRASDELRILVAKSMNEVFKTIVPHLSTPYKEDLSYDGMRSKSYAAEERDKQIAIETLEKIINKIKMY